MQKNYKKSKDIWDIFKELISDSDIVHISQSDYGYEEKKNYNSIKDILDRGQLPKTLEWIPREVLSLVRWDEYKNDTKLTARVFFCSTLLLLASKNSESIGYLDGQVENIIISIDTANILGSEKLEVLFSVFEEILSKITIRDFEEDYLYFYLGFYLLAILTKKTDTVIQNIIGKVSKIEKQMYDYPQKDILKYTCFDQKIIIWKEYLIQYDKFNLYFKRDLKLL